MENSEKVMTEQESLLLIGQMIQQAKQSVQENGFIFLLWGWLVLAAALSNYVLLYVVRYEHHYLPWPVLMTLGGIISIVHGQREKKREPAVKTHLGIFMKYLWIAFGVSLAFVLLYMAKIGVQQAYPLILVVYGIGTFVTGGALNFRPLIIGGICCWVLAVIAVFFSFQVQLLLLSLAIIVAYIIPGHLLKNRAAHEKI
ncbi:MAG TPA: hypothetical protein VK927_06525 [Adhaeribacter sp.]|nr:hypothetical protein [Adhaeribacter sp.]